MHWSKIVIFFLILLLLFTVAFFFRKRNGYIKRIKREPLLDDGCIDAFEEDDSEESALVEKDLMEPMISGKVSEDEEIFKVENKENEIISFVLMAKPGSYYSGYELLQVLLSFGFCFGEMNIFHKHKSEDGSGPIIFSLAQAVTPGTFDLDDVGGIKCLGPALFMELSDMQNALIYFEKMLDTARQLAEELGGDLFDEKKRPLDNAYLDSLRAKIDVWGHKQNR